jgi:hypothetical protein
MYTIHSNVLPGSKAFLMLTAILSGKSERIYDQLFQMIIEFAVENGLLINPKISITDFEKESINSMRRTFPDVKTYGCNFHFGHILYQRMQKMKLSTKYSADEEFSIEVKCMMALSFLEEEEMFTMQNFTLRSRLLADWVNKHYVNGENNRPPSFRQHLGVVLIWISSKFHGTRILQSLSIATSIKF